MNSYFSQIQRGIDFIEAHLHREIALSDVASYSGLSLWHFQRVFKAVTHETLKSYIRLRRLSVAYERLSNTDDRILDIALDSGFESQESFSRAFKKIYKIAPNQARKLKQKNLFFAKLQLTRDYLEHVQSRVSLEPEITQLGPLKLVGMQTQFFGEESDKNNMTAKIDPLWDAFMPRLDEITQIIPNIGYGVICQVDKNEELLSYTAACPVSCDGNIPNGMINLEVAAATYAVFSHKGLPEELNKTIDYAYAAWLMNSSARPTGGCDLVIYGSEYKENSHDSLIHYAIPIALPN